MFRDHLDQNDGLALIQKQDSRIDSSIHMFFVPFALLVVWVSSDMMVVSKTIAKPWRPAYFPEKPARYILEIHPDRLDEFQVGNRVEFIDD